MASDPSTPVRSGGLVERAKAILLRPKEEWPRIAAESSTPTDVLIRYALPLAAIGPIATLIGGQVFGYGVLGISWRPSIAGAIGTAIATYVLSLLSLFVVAFIANFLSPKFDGRDNWPAAFKLVAFSMTAAWVTGIFGLVPALGILGLLGLYSIYLLYTGAAPMMGVPQDKTGTYTAVTIVAAIVVNIVVGLIVASITGAAVAGAPADDETMQVDLGEYGNMTIDGDNQTIDLGELGKVEIDGDTATVTVDGQEMKVNVEDLPEE